MPKRKSLYQGYNIIVNGNIESDNSPRVFFRVFIFRCTCANDKFNYWESPLVGAEQGELCENPECAGNPRVIGVEVIGTTPVQEENNKLFGHFKCHGCQRTWCSAHSWANTSQKCRDCMIDIYPYIQKPLRRGLGINLNIPHNSALCQKCRAISGNCSKVGGHGSRRRSRGGRRRAAGRHQGIDGGLPDALGRLIIQD